VSYVTTLIAPQQAPFFDNAPLRALQDAGVRVNERVVQDPARAIDLITDAPVAGEALDTLRDAFGIDVICQDLEKRKKRLFMADMDATMVTEETLDELAAYAGIKDQIAAITARAMNGELDFAAALRERVGLLAGLPENTLAETAGKMHFTQGGDRLLRTLKNHGVYCVLVSGGFTYFTGHVARTLGFDENHGNTLNIENGALTGTVGDPILDKNFKKKCLEDTAKRLNLSLDETVAIGDGANDLPMLQTAGLGVGWRSKKILRDTLPNHIFFGGLDSLIYALGLPPL
jgi:phosphoserine phosphatase